MSAWEPPVRGRNRKDGSAMGSHDNDRISDVARDVLISRVVDGEASADDWRALADLAARDQSLWADLGTAQRQHDTLTLAMDRAAAPAASVELPAFAADTSAAHRLRLVSAWGGWAAAAVVAFAWSTNLDLPMGGPGAEVQSAGFVRIPASPEAALDRYLDAGRASGTVIREMPDPVVCHTQPLESGGVEVLYLRQILERRIVDQVYRRAADEFGRSVELPVEHPRPALAPTPPTPF